MCLFLTRGGDDASGGAMTGGFGTRGFGTDGSGGGANGSLTGGFGVDVSEVDKDAARRDEVVRALNAWQEAVPDLIRFRTAETPEESALKVVWQDLPSDKVGSYRYTFSVLEGGIYRFRATEILLDPDTPPDDLYRYALLEIGHALGLLGRSPFEGDAMSAVPSGRVSERDVATLRALYALPSGDCIEEVASPQKRRGLAARHTWVQELRVTMLQLHARAAPRQISSPAGADRSCRLDAGK